MVGEGKAERETRWASPSQKNPGPVKSAVSNASHLNHVRMFRVRNILFKRRQTIYQSWDFPHIPLRHTIVHCLFECIHPIARFENITYCLFPILFQCCVDKKIVATDAPVKRFVCRENLYLYWTKKMKQYSSNRWWDQMSTEGPIEICRKPSCCFFFYRWTLKEVKVLVGCIFLLLC